MFGRVFRTTDPFEGTGARRRNVRVQVESFVAFALAIGACGLTAAMWLRILAPYASQFGLG
jgi:hypothetical protein